MMNSKLMNIYYINGQFLIFNKQDAIDLRSRRITWQLVGATQSSATLPCQISHYGARICFENKWATFLGLTCRVQSIESARRAWYSQLEEIKANARDEFIYHKELELVKRGIEATPDRIGDFDEANVRIPVQLEPSDKTSTCKPYQINDIELDKLIQLDNDKWGIHKDLFERGFYITSGLKFGGDFLAYQGDPVMYHGTFVVRVLPANGNTIDLDKVNYMELNTILRLCHGSNKIPMFGIISNGERSPKICYYTLRTKKYIQITKSSSNFETLDPRSEKKYIFCENNSSEVDHHSKRMKVDI